MAFVRKGREKILQYEKRENVMTRDDLYNSWDENAPHGIISKLNTMEDNISDLEETKISINIERK